MLIKAILWGLFLIILAIGIPLFTQLPIGADVAIFIILGIIGSFIVCAGVKWQEILNIAHDYMIENKPQHQEIDRDEIEN